MSGEIEFIDEKSILRSSKTSVDEDIILDNNQQIASNFTNTVNFKVGAEYKASPELMLRAGYNLLGSAADLSTSNRFKTSAYSVGAGYRFMNSYIDLAYQKVMYDTEFQPYVLNSSNSSGPAPTASVKNGRNSMFFTFGVRF
jgi:long-subunit fatty acid transport protein